jgi:predicted amidohydrolase
MNDLKVTLIQADLSWEDKEKNLEMFSRKISAIEGQTDLIVLPEMFTSGFTMNAKSMAEKMDGHTVEWMKIIAEEKKCAITGSLIIEENGKFYNRLIWAEKDHLIYYDKRHLFSLAKEEKNYSPGDSKIIIELKDWKILPLICYDLRFPVWSRRTMDEDYDLMIYVANWPERRVNAWKQLLIARAIENQCYVIGLNRVGMDGHSVFHSGDSEVIDFKGDKLINAKAGEEFTQTVLLSKTELDEFRTQFSFFDDGDAFEIF